MQDKNYIITAHKNPLQLSHLINTLTDGYSHFFIHIDQKVDIKPFLKVIKGDHIHFVEDREDCIWADFSQVKATLKLIDAVVASGRKCVTIFISGQDYPVKSIKYINDFLSDNKKDFITFIKDPILKNDSMYVERIDLFKINLSNKRDDFVLIGPFLKLNRSHYKRIFINFFKGRISLMTLKYFFVKRQSIFDIHYKGTNWWSFQYESLKSILDYVHINSEKLFKYYKYTLSADEQFFHTIYRKLELQKKFGYQETLTYTNWDRKGVPLPVTFATEDIQELRLLPENKLFARKFDTDIDDRVFNHLDDFVKKG